MLVRHSLAWSLLSSRALNASPVSNSGNINKDGKAQLVVCFVYYATELLNGKVKDEEVAIAPGHPLYTELSALRSGDEIRAIPLTNEITCVIPHNWLFRQVLDNNGL